MRVTGVVASLGHDEPNEVCGVVGVVRCAAPPIYDRSRDGGRVGWVKRGLGVFHTQIFRLLAVLNGFFLSGHPSWCIRACEQEFKKEQVGGSESLTSPWCVAWSCAPCGVVSNPKKGRPAKIFEK